MPTPSDDTCIECGREWDEHTMAQFREHWPAAHPTAEWSDIPAELDYAPEYRRGQDHIAHGVTMDIGVDQCQPDVALALGRPEFRPCIRFTFINRTDPADDVSIVMTLDDEDAVKMRRMLSAGIDQALMVTKKARRGR